MILEAGLVAALFGSWINRSPEHQCSAGPYVLRYEERVEQTPEGSGWWGAISSTSRVITRLTINRGKEEVIVPRSAFGDLADVLSVHGRATKTGCEFSLVGGDGSESFKARIVVRGLDVASREVWDPAFPQFHREKTVYTDKEPPG